jgi:hypothetical protein
VKPKQLAEEKLYTLEDLSTLINEALRHATPNEKETLRRKLYKQLKLTPQQIKTLGRDAK